MSDLVVSRRAALELIAAAGVVAVSGGAPVFAAKQVVGGALESLDPEVEVNGFVTVNGTKKKSTFDVDIKSTNLPAGSELAFYYEEPQMTIEEADADVAAGPVNAVFLGLFKLTKKQKGTGRFSYSLPFIEAGRVTIWLRVTETEEQVVFGTLISVTPK